MSEATVDREALQDYEGEIKHNFKWNFTMLTLDGVFFIFALGFVNDSSILPVFVSSLTDSSILVGLIIALRMAGWYIPQLFIARYSDNWRRKKPFVVLISATTRAVFVPLALITYFYGRSNPVLVLSVFYLSFAIFTFGDGTVGVPWMDMMAKAIPTLYRGRLFGGMQFVGGLLAMGAGILIKYILSHPQYPFPQNYALLFLITFIFIELSALAVYLFREPIYPRRRTRKTFREHLRNLRMVMKRDKTFSTMIIAKLLGGFGGMSFPFYAIYAKDILGVNIGMIGLFVTARMVGNTLASPFWAYISDKVSNRLVIRLYFIVAILTPLSTLFLGYGTRYGLFAGKEYLLGYLYLSIFFLIGFVASGEWLGYTNFTLEIAKPEEHSTYIALLNSLSSPLVILPLLGGMVVQWISYEAVFITSTLFITIGLCLTRRLREPRQKLISS